MGEDNTVEGFSAEGSTSGISPRGEREFGDQERQANQRNSLAFVGSSSNPSNFGVVQRSAPLQEVPEAAPSPELVRPPQKASARRREQRTETERSTRKAQGEELLPEVSPDSFTQCDPRLTPIEVLNLISEVLSPQGRTELQFDVDPSTTSPVDERVSMFEFAEMEMVFSEFLRLLLRASETCLRSDPLLMERLSPAARLDGFLRHVFLPSLQNPYVAPLPTHDELNAEPEEKIDPPAPDPTPAEPEAAADEEGEPGEEGDHEDEEVQAKEPVPITYTEMWRGFDSGPNTLMEAARAPRAWPEGYEQDVMHW